MLLRDVKVGQLYLALRFGRVQAWEWPPRDAVGWQKIGERGHPVRALEVGVDIPGYRRKGVRVQYLDRDTLEPLRYGDPDTSWGDPDLRGRVCEPVAMMAVGLLMPWAEFFVLYHEYLDEAEEEAERRRELREQENARRQEAAAREWMEERFSEARRDIEQVCEVINGEPGRTAIDDELRALVELRYPRGNPYLNGERTAHG